MIRNNGLANKMEDLIAQHLTKSESAKNRNDHNDDDSDFINHSGPAVSMDVVIPIKSRFIRLEDDGNKENGNSRKFHQRMVADISCIPLCTLETTFGTSLGRQLSAVRSDDTNDVLYSLLNMKMRMMSTDGARIR